MNNKTIWKFFIDNYKFTLLLVFSAFLFGLVSIYQIPKESSPEVEIPYAVVVSVYPGANAEDVEELVTQPLEDKIKSLDDLDKLTSQSQNSLSIIYVQFDSNSDVQEKMNDLKDKIDQVKKDLPEDVDDPSVVQISLDDVPILTFSISGPYTRIDMKRFADEIKDEIGSISGVSKVDILGGQDEEIKVIVDKAKMDNYNISLAQIIQAISYANSDIPAGSIESAGIEYTVRFSGRLSDLEEIKKIPLTNINNVPILLKDVANVYSDFTELKTMSRLSKNSEDSKLAVSLSLYKSSGGDTVQIVKNVLNQLEKLKKNYPEDLSFDISKNVAQDIKSDLSNLLVNGLETVLIVVGLLFLFLGWREALLTGLSVPLTFLISFIFLELFGYTLNFLTLFSLILSLGILVDNAIVVAEGIYVHTSKGVKIKEACLISIKEYQWVLTAGTMTTILAFLPLLIVSGVVGKFMVSIPVTITIVLLASLFVALALIPTLASLYFQDKEVKDFKDGEESEDLVVKKNVKEIVMNFINSKYNILIKSLLSNHKKSKRFLKYIIFSFIFSLALLFTGILKIQMFPAGDEPKVYIDFKMPVGTPLEITSKKIEEVENVLVQDKEIDSFLVTIGSQTGGGSFLSADSSGNSHYAGIVVNLSEDKKNGSTAFIKEYNQKLKQIGGFEFELSQDVMGPPSSDPISISVEGESLEILDNISNQIKQILEEIPGTRSVHFVSEDSPGEFVLEIDRVKAQIFGVATVQIASVLRSSIAGVDATVIRNNGKEINVLVKNDLDGLNDGISNKQIDLNNIKSITIPSSKGDIPLASFIKSDLNYSRSLVQHEDGKRIKKIVGNVETGVASQTVFTEAKKKIKNIDLPEGYVINFGGEDEDMQKSFTDIFKALVLSLILITFLLVLQFNSFKQTLFILVAVPLALIGVLPGLVLVGQPLSFPGAIGIVALVGIVVKNAIILIEKININRRNGLGLDDSIREAGSSRLRPIILTTITTVLGMIPLALSDPTWGPLGFAIVFGLSFSTILTLVVLPVIYQKFSQGEKEK